MSQNEYRLRTISNEQMDEFYKDFPDFRGLPTYKSEDGRIWPKPLKESEDVTER